MPKPNTNPSKGTPMQKFMQITEVREVIKAGKVTHEVSGTCTAEEVDGDNEICDYADTKPLYEQWRDETLAATTAAGQEPSMGNVRVQHSGGRVGGKVTDMGFDDEGKRITVKTEPIDDEMARQIKKGFYTGFSQGGAALYRICNVCKTDCGEPGNNFCPHCQQDVVVRYACAPKEISYVDRPCVGSATFNYVKADGSMEVLKFAKPAKEVIQKDSKTRRVAGEDLPASAFAYVGDANDTSTWKLPIKFSTEAKTKSHIRNALSRFSQTQGIPDSDRSRVHAKIVAVARRYGIAVSAKAEGANMGVTKSLYHIGWVAEIMNSIRNLRDSNRYEADFEGDERDAAIADELDELLGAMIGVGRSIYDEETDELLTAVNKAAGNKGANMKIEDVMKAARKGLAHHFTKAAVHYKQMAELHKDLHEENLAAAETHKAVMEDDECKSMHATHKALHATHKSMAAHHLKLHKAYEAHATHHEAMAKAHAVEVEPEKADTGLDVAKAAATPTPTPAPVAAPAQAQAPVAATDTADEGGAVDITKALEGTTTKLIESALEKAQGSPELAKAVEAAITKMLMNRLGGVEVPTGTGVAAPQLVPRAGQEVNKAAPVALPASGPVDLGVEVPLEFSDMCELDMGN